MRWVLSASGRQTRLLLNFLSVAKALQGRHPAIRPVPHWENLTLVPFDHDVPRPDKCYWGLGVFRAEEGRCYASGCLLCWGDVSSRLERLGLTAWPTWIAAAIPKQLSFSESRGERLRPSPP